MATSTESKVVLEVKDLQVHFRTRWGLVRAVDGVSFDLRQGETLGIVGESGCGKSITSVALLRLVPYPGKIVGGSITLDGQDVLAMSNKEVEHIRGRKISLILQDPMSSLNPVYTIGNQVGEAVTVQGKRASSALKDRVVDLLRQVKIPVPEERARNYPHEMSGGMRQRVVGAMGVASRPLVLIADEPTTSLDVTTQLQYLNLLKELQTELNVGMIFITHDFGIVSKMCDRVAVMYAGRVVETGTLREVFNAPEHPYTRALLNSVPRVEEKIEKLDSIDGQPPILHSLPVGCRFAPRCAHAMDICTKEYPPTTGEGSHRSACWLEKVNA